MKSWSMDTYTALVVTSTKKAEQDDDSYRSVASSVVKKPC